MRQPGTHALPISRVAPIGHHGHCQIRLLECFAGGFGGWKRALQARQTPTVKKIKTIGIEIDKSALPWETFQEKAHDRIICDTIPSNRWIETVSAWSPNIVTVSAPCQSWSYAGHRSGLEKECGMALIECIVRLGC